MLVGLGNTTAATESEILTMASALAQSTAQFKIGSTTLAGLGAAAAELDFRPELFGTAVQRTLGSLSKAAAQGTEGMAKLSQATGMSQDAFAALIKDNPTEAFFKFLDVLKRMNADGQNISGFLEEFQLQGEESIKVLGTAAAQLDLFKQKVRDAKGEADKGTALDEEYAKFAQTLNSQFIVLQNNI